MKLKFKKIMYYILLPFTIAWMALSVGIMKLGDGLHWLGNAMTGFRADDSIGTVHVK